MVWRCVWQMECEVCKWTSAPFSEGENAEAWGRSEGWLCGNAGPFRCHLCRDCARMPEATLPALILGERVVWEEPVVQGPT